MKALKTIKILTVTASLLSIAVVGSSVSAQEYDDMYFNKTDRKTVKIDKNLPISNSDNSVSNANYKELTKSTETYSAKNINPEYIARYKSTESNEVTEQANTESYSNDDYFVEGYDATNNYVGDTNNGDIDYAALNKRDQMSYSNYTSSNSNRSWGFSPYMAMGMGMGMMSSPYRRYGYNPYMMGYDPYMMGYDPYMMGYNPYMMGYGSGMSMGIGMGFGSGFGYPSMSYGLSMSYGFGGGYGGYSPYGMGGFNPYGSMYGYNPYNSFCSPYAGRGYGGYGTTMAVISTSGNESLNGRNISYKPRTTRSNVSSRNVAAGVENRNVSTSKSNIRVPNRTVSNTSSASNGRVSKDYSKAQNEYYNNARRTSSSAQRISNSGSKRNSYSRSSSSASRYSSSINSNKPSRATNYSNSYNSRSSSPSYGKSSSGFSSGSRSSSSSSFSTPSRGSSSGYSSGSSGARSSGSSGSRSSGSSRSGGRQ